MTPDQVVEQIRCEVLEHTKISVSAGIAPNARVFSTTLPTPFIKKKKQTLNQKMLIASKSRLEPKQAKRPICKHLYPNPFFTA